MKLLEIKSRVYNNRLKTLISSYPLRRTAFTLALLCMVSVPMAASAAPTVSNVVIGSIDVSSLTSQSAKPTLSGLVFGANTIEVRVRKEGTSKILFKSKTITIKDSAWKAEVTKKLSDGTYDVEVRGVKKDAKLHTITTGVLTINTKATSAATTLVVSTVPLLVGGTAYAGLVVPVAYLQITNVGSAPATITGFIVKQNGSAPTGAVIALTSVDDRGGSRVTTPGLTPFKDGVATAPNNVVFAPKQMRLFTVKAVMNTNVAAYVGKSLMIDVVGINTTATIKGTFPMRGVTWTIK